MTTGTISLDSAALQGATTYSIILPDAKKAGPGPYPVLLQLHGMHDDHSAWLDKSRLWSYVERLPMIVVMPSGGNFWWSNLGLHEMLGTERPEFALDYESYLLEDLWTHVNGMFPVQREQRWAIGGLSMGGFGAVRLGLKYPDRFCSIYGHSSVFPSGDEIARMLPLLTPARREDMDIYHWASVRAHTQVSLSEVSHMPSLPRLSFDCGVDDFLIAQNGRFHAHLDDLGLPHTYREYPGAHTWDYWDLHVREALTQHCEVLGINALATITH